MYDRIKVMGESLAVQGKYIEFKGNSVLSVIEESPKPLSDMAFIAERVSAIMINEVVMLKEKLLPLKQELEGYVKTFKKEHKFDNPLKDYSVVPLRIPSVVTELQNKGFIKHMESATLPVSTIMVEKSTEEIVSLFKFENNVLDHRLEELRLQISKQELNAIWEKYMTNISNTNTNISRLMYGGYKYINDLVVLLVWVNNIKDNKPKNTLGSVDAYLTQMDRFYDYLIMCLDKAISTYEMETKIDKLVINIEKKTIYVNDDIYEKYLDSGKIEALLGILLSNDSVNTAKVFLNEILAEQDSLIEVWERQVRLSEIRATQNDDVVYLEAYRSASRKLAENIPQDLYEQCLIRVPAIESNLDILLSRPAITNIKDIGNVSRYIIGEMFFPKTRFTVFTSYMLTYLESNPDIKTKDAATYAVLDIIVDYVLAQLDLES